MIRDEIMKQRIRKLRIVFYIVAGFLAVEVVFGITTGSELYSLMPVIWLRMSVGWP